jgi:hypothetical protein
MKIKLFSNHFFSFFKNLNQSICIKCFADLAQENNSLKVLFYMFLNIKLTISFPITALTN